MFAEGRPREQTIDEIFVGPRPAIVRELIGFLRRGRQSGEIEADAPNQRVTIGGRRGPEMFAFEPRENKGVHGIPDPALIFHRRERRAERVFVGPMRGGKGAPRGSNFYYCGFRGAWLAARLHRGAPSLPVP